MSPEEEYQRLLAEQNAEAETVKEVFIPAKTEDRVSEKKFNHLKVDHKSEIYHGLEAAVSDKPNDTLVETNIKDLEELAACEEVVDG